MTAKVAPADMSLLQGAKESGHTAAQSGDDQGSDDNREFQSRESTGAEVCVR